MPQYLASLLYKQAKAQTLKRFSEFFKENLRGFKWIAFPADSYTNLLTLKSWRYRAFRWTPGLWFCHFSWSAHNFVRSMKVNARCSQWCYCSLVAAPIHLLERIEWVYELSMVNQYFELEVMDWTLLLNSLTNSVVKLSKTMFFQTVVGMYDWKGVEEGDERERSLNERQSAKLNIRHWKPPGLHRARWLLRRIYPSLPSILFVTSIFLTVGT